MHCDTADSLARASVNSVHILARGHRIFADLRADAYALRHYAFAALLHERPHIMKHSFSFPIVFFLLAVAGLPTFPRKPRLAPDMATPQEKHLRNVHQLTFGGQNAEAYFSADGKKLIYQSSHGDVKCDQIFTMNIDGSDQHMVSTGKGRTTCSFFYPDGKKILYASTHLASPECPPRPDFSKGYVWAVYSGYDIFTANPDGSNLKQLTNTPGYDAEATISTRRQEDYVHFHAQRRPRHLHHGRRRQEREATHARTRLRRRADVFSRRQMDCVSRVSSARPKKKSPTTKNCWRQNLIRPTSLEIWIMKADGSRQEADHESRRGELWSGVHCRRQENHLLFELRS